MSLLHIHHRIKILLACVLACTASIAHACGPDFPNQVIAGGSENVLRIPTGRFSAELDALNLADEPPFKAEHSRGLNVYDDSAAVDLTELLSVLTKDGKPADASVLKQYTLIRKLISDHAAALDKPLEDPGSPKPPPMQNVVVPPGLPLEFDQYLRGLIAFHRDDPAAAQKIWKGLLAFPAEQRSHRSTWAAFALGKSYMDSDPAQAIEYFRMTRKLAADGFADLLGLASSSLGWEAKVAFNGGDFDHAIHLYIQQRWTGDESADASLRQCAEKILSGAPAALAAAAADADARRVVTAFVICDAGPFHSLSKEQTQRIPEWLLAVESAAVKDMPGADRLAWLAYSSGDFAQAGRWVARSPRDSAVANWVRAKLLLRDGKIDDAAGVLVKVVRSFPPSDFPYAEFAYPSEGPDTAPRCITTDLAVLQLARGQYSDSMRLLMVSNHWQDAAYIAERVLTANELKTFVDQYCPFVAAKAGSEQVPAWEESSRKLRLLLARRLTREGHWKTARDYFTADLQVKLDVYIAGIRGGHDKTRPDPDRAAAYMSAARIAHANGMELLGTELSPDFAIYGGSYDLGKDDDRLTEKGLTAPTPDELARFEANAPNDTRRFHYRYTAAEHAWDAAELMPDDSEQTAKVLYEAGCWLKDRDPKFADKFYKALVQRCPDTDLGRAAAEAHWFPTAQAATIKK